MVLPRVDSAPAAAEGSGASDGELGGLQRSLGGHGVARPEVGDHDHAQRRSRLTGRRSRSLSRLRPGSPGRPGRTPRTENAGDRHRQEGATGQGDRTVPGPPRGPCHAHATKYLASGWWQMMASVVCSGLSWNPSLTVTPMRSPPSSSTTLALSVRSGQAG